MCVCVCVCVLLYSIYVSLSRFFRVWTPFNILRMFCVLLFWTSQKDVVRAREKARGDRGDRGLSAPGVSRTAGFYFKPLQFSVSLVTWVSHIITCFLAYGIRRTRVADW